MRERPPPLKAVLAGDAARCQRLLASGPRRAKSVDRWETPAAGPRQLRRAARVIAVLPALQNQVMPRFSPASPVRRTGREPAIWAGIGPDSGALRIGMRAPASSDLGITVAGPKLLPEPLGKLSRHPPRVWSGLNRAAPRAGHGRHSTWGSPAVPADPPVPAGHDRVIGEHLPGCERPVPSAARAPQARGRVTVVAGELRDRRDPQRRALERARDRAALRTPHVVALAGHRPVARDGAHQPEHEHLPAPGPHLHGPAAICKHSRPGAVRHHRDHNGASRPPGMPHQAPPPGTAPAVRKSVPGLEPARQAGTCGVPEVPLAPVTCVDRSGMVINRVPPSALPHLRSTVWLPGLAWPAGGVQ
jgi:hypothetical protein